MDHAPASLPFQPLPPEIASTGARIVSFMHSGGRCVVLVGAPGSGKTATLDAVLAGMPAWVERVSNRIPQPLTLARVLAQLSVEAGAPDPGAAMLRTLAERAGPHRPAVLAIDDAHSLTDEALVVLAGVPGLGGPDAPGLVLLLAGRPGLQGMVRRPGLARLRGAETLTLRMAARGGLVPERRGVWPYALTGVGVAALALGLLLQGGVPNAAIPGPAPPPGVAVQQPEPVPLSLPPPPEFAAAPALAAPAEPVAELAPEPPSASPKPLPSDAQLRRDFDVFLNRAGRDTAQLTAPARETLFREYLQWRGRSAP